MLVFCMIVVPKLKVKLVFFFIIVLRQTNSLDLPKNGTLFCFANASPPPFENTFVTSCKEIEQRY